MFIQLPMKSSPIHPFGICSGCGASLICAKGLANSAAFPNVIKCGACNVVHAAALLDEDVRRMRNLLRERGTLTRGDSDLYRSPFFSAIAALA